MKFFIRLTGKKKLFKIKKWNLTLNIQKSLRLTLILGFAEYREVDIWQLEFDNHGLRTTVWQTSLNLVFMTKNKTWHWTYKKAYGWSSYTDSLITEKLTTGKAVFAWCQNQLITEVTINGLRCTRSRAPLLVASKR